MESENQTTEKLASLGRKDKRVGLPENVMVYVTKWYKNTFDVQLT